VRSWWPVDGIQLSKNCSRTVASGSCRMISTSEKKRHSCCSLRGRTWVEVHLPAADRADFDSGADGIVRTRPRGKTAASGPDFHAHRCLRQPGPGTFHISGRNERGSRRFSTLRLRQAWCCSTEVGRGTATFDGLSLAWAVVESLHAGARPEPCRNALPRTDDLERLLPG